VVTSALNPGPSADSAAGPGPSRHLPTYAGTIFAIGASVLIAICTIQLPDIDWGSRLMRPSYLLAGLLFAGELRRLRVVRKDGDTDRLTVSSTFAVALVMTGPLCLALLAQVTATALDDIRRRRPPIVIAFNLGQYSLTLLGVRAVFALPERFPVLGTGLLPGPIPLWPAIAAAFAYFVLNNVIVGGVVALANGQPIRDVLVEDLRVQSLDSAILLGLAPITAIISTRELALAPLIVLPLLGVQRNAWIAAQRQHESLHDELTGLPNRALFRVRADKALRAAGENGRMAVMLVDLDHFKEVNDTLGHHIGDGLLREVATRMEQALPDGITVARLGGDEFAIVVPRVSSVDEVASLAEQVMERIREPLMAEGIRLGVQASIGFAVYPEHGDSIETLLQRADIAMYRAKTNRGEVQEYRTDLDPHSVQRLSLHGDLHAVIGGPQLEMLYQPQVDAGTGTPVGFEALMRWNHPAHGQIMPDIFIPMAENTGLIAPLTRFSVEASLTTLSFLRPTYPQLAVAVNLSARLLADLSLPSWLAASLARAQVPADRLTIEVTESSITADANRAVAVLADLRDQGIRIAIDDFGTGYSSLSYLTKLQPDEIKIDKSFVMKMLEHEPSAVIVRSTIDLAHSLGLKVVAEGVEDQATYDVLAGMGCDRIQGYHVAAAMAGDALSGWNQARHDEFGPSWAVEDPFDASQVIALRPFARSL
jgi:diguanylate cyclase (GGDEF)-like protein